MIAIYVQQKHLHCHMYNHSLYCHMYNHSHYCLCSSFTKPDSSCCCRLFSVSPDSVPVKEPNEEISWLVSALSSLLVSPVVVCKSTMWLDVPRRLVFFSLQAVPYGGLIGDWVGARGSYGLSSLPYITMETSYKDCNIGCDKKKGTRQWTSEVRTL